MLYLETQEGFVPWRGQPIDGVVHPIQIEQRWTAEALEAIGLFSPADPGVPADKVVVSSAVERIEGVVTLVHTLADASPTDFPLAPAQFFAMIEISGYGPDIEAAIEAITDPIDRAVVRSKYRNSGHYKRDNELLTMLLPAVGISDQELDALWMVAKDLAP